MSATPIPRTLEMSLAGIREIEARRRVSFDLGKRANAAVGPVDPATGERHVEGLKVAQAGRQSAQEFDQTARDITNFLEYVGEPAALKRQSVGVWVILFLAALTFLAYLLKQEYWKDVH